MKNYPAYKELQDRARSHVDGSYQISVNIIWNKKEKKARNDLALFQYKIAYLIWAPFLRMPRLDALNDIKPPVASHEKLSYLCRI